MAKAGSSLPRWRGDVIRCDLLRCRRRVACGVRFDREADISQVVLSPGNGTLKYQPGARMRPLGHWLTYAITSHLRIDTVGAKLNVSTEQSLDVSFWCPWGL